MSRSSWLIPAALSCAVLAGCGGTPAATTPPAASAAPAATAVSGDAAGWMDKYCGALTGFVAAARTVPDIDPTSPEKTISGLSTYVDDYVAAMDDAIANLKTVGPAPSAVGDAAVADLTTTMTTFRTTLGKVKKQLDASSADDIDKVMEPLSSLEDPPDPLKAVSKDSQLSAAARTAPNCQKIPASG